MSDKAVYARTAIMRMGGHVEGPTMLLCDAESALRVASGETSVARLKHDLRRSAIVTARYYEHQMYERRFVEGQSGLPFPHWQAMTARMATLLPQLLAEEGEGKEAEAETGSNNDKGEGGQQSAAPEAAAAAAAAAAVE